MNKLTVFFAALALTMIGLVGTSGKVLADGCYTCSSTDSKDACKGMYYCSYKGSDSSENRKKCKKKGCKITGTASCPTSANYKSKTCRAD